MDSIEGPGSKKRAETAQARAYFFVECEKIKKLFDDGILSEEQKKVETQRVTEEYEEVLKEIEDRHNSHPPAGVQQKHGARAGTKRKERDAIAPESSDGSAVRATPVVAEPVPAMATVVPAVAAVRVTKPSKHDHRVQAPGTGRKGQQQRHMYTVFFKNEVLNRLEAFQKEGRASPKLDIASLYKIDRSLVTKWHQKKDEIRAACEKRPKGRPSKEWSVVHDKALKSKYRFRLAGAGRRPATLPAESQVAHQQQYAEHRPPPKDNL